VLHWLLPAPAAVDVGTGFSRVSHWLLPAPAAVDVGTGFS